MSAPKEFSPRPRLTMGDGAVQPASAPLPALVFLVAGWAGAGTATVSGQNLVVKA